MSAAATWREGTTYGRRSVTLENAFLQLALFSDTGEGVQLTSRRTGHEHLCVRAGVVGADGQGYAEALPFRPRVNWGFREESPSGGVGETAASRTADGVEAVHTRESDGIRLVVRFSLADRSCRVIVSKEVTNTGRADRALQPGTGYHLIVGSEVGPVWNPYHGDKDENLHVIHGGQKIFVGQEPVRHGDSIFDTIEAAEQRVQLISHNRCDWPNARWVAVVDTIQEEGVALRFLEGIDHLTVRHQVQPLNNSLYVAHRGPNLRLAPGQTHRTRYEIWAFDGVRRVDFVGDGYLAGIDLVRTILSSETQEATVHVLAVDQVHVSGEARIRSDRIDAAEKIDMDLSPTAHRSISLTSGPYSGMQTIRRLWYYTDIAVASLCGRPIPRLTVDLNGASLERRFVVSPQFESIRQDIDAVLSDARAAYQAGRFPAEGLGGILALARVVEEHRRESAVEQPAYEALRRMRAIFAAFEGGDRSYRLFPVEELRAKAGQEPIQGWLSRLEEWLRPFLNEPVAMGRPGRKELAVSYRWADAAVRLSYFYALGGGEAYGQKAKEVLLNFGRCHADYTFTGMGNAPLGMCMQLDDLVLAYDWVSDLLTPEEHALILRYFFWSFDFFEPHASVTGHNDEIVEGGVLACLASRFPYLPEAGLRKERGVGVLRKHMDFFSEDGGWPESPSYNNMILREYILAAEWLRRGGTDLYGEVKGRSLDRAVAWTATILTPKLEWPALGDTMRARPAPEIFLIAAARYKSSDYLALGRRLAEIDPDKPHGVLTHKLVLAHPLALAAYPVDLQESRALGARTAVLPRTGYLVIRSGHEPDDAYFISDFGPNKIGHGHADRLSFELHAFGEVLVVDPGYGQGATSCHNLVMVDQTNQDRWTEGTLSLFATGAQSDFARMEIEGYEGVHQAREVIHHAGRLLLLHDTARSARPHRYDWIVHLKGEAGEITADEGGLTLRKAESGVGLRVLLLRVPQEGGTPVLVGKDEWRIESDPYPGVREGHLSRCAVDTTGAQVDHIALLAPFRGEAPEVSLEGVAGHDQVALTLSVDGRRYAVASARQGSVRIGDLDVDARMGLFCLETGYLSAAGVRRLRYKGAALLDVERPLELTETIVGKG